MAPPLKRVVVLLSVLLCSGASHASVEVELSSTEFNVSGSGDVTSVSISGPGGYYRQTTVNGSSAMVQLSSSAVGPDGLYTYEIKSYHYGGWKTISDPDNGRENASQRVVNAVDIKTGTYHVVNGLIVHPDNTVE